MLRYFSITIFILLITISIFGQQTIANQKTETKANPQNISGSYLLKYSNVKNSLEVRLLPNNKIKFHLIALLYTGSDSPHNGEIEDTIPLVGDTATYQNGNCKIVMKFSNNLCEITESEVDDCGFGAYVTAAGKYKKRASRTK